MKVRPIAVLALGTVAFAFAALFAEDTGTKSEVRINLDELPRTPAPNKPVAPAPATPAKPAVPAQKTTAKPVVKKDAAPPKIEGMEIRRDGDRGFLGVKVVDSNFKVFFYDKDKKAKKVDVESAALRWPVHYQPNDERAFLTPTADGKALTSDKVVRSPYTFILHITLLKNTDPGDAAVAETYVVDFNG